MQQSIVSFKTAGGRVQHGPVVPHDEHVRLPLMPVNAFFLSLPSVQLAQQFFCRNFIHTFDTDGVTHAAENGLTAIDRVGDYQRVSLGFSRIIRNNRLHGAFHPGIGLAVQAVR